MSLSAQISALHRQGISATDIAAALSTAEMPIDKRTVEFTLAREQEISDEDIPEEDFKVIRQRLIDIAKNSDDDWLAAKVGMFCFEQKRGSAKLKGAPAINISHINAMFVEAQNRVGQIVKELKVEDEVSTSK